jgi:sulfoxide reductase heme-binding subunit YedZ
MLEPSMSTKTAPQSSNQLGRPLGTSRDWRRRLLFHHVPIVLASAVVLVLFMGWSPVTSSESHGGADIESGPFPVEYNRGSRMDMGDAGGQTAGFALSFEPGSQDWMLQATVATGYVATGLLGLTLLIGPANLLLRRRNPVSTPLPRDLGIWAAIASIVHVILGLQLWKVRSGILSFLDFFVADGMPLTNSFGLGNWTGLAALVIVVGLLAISTDRSLRDLKAKRWKNLQRLNYALFALVVLHAFFYGALLQVTPFTLVLIVTVLAVFVGQLVGIRLWRRRLSRTAATQRERQLAKGPSETMQDEDLEVKEFGHAEHR